MSSKLPPPPHFMRNCLFLLLWAVSLLAPNAVKSQNPCDDWAIEISAVPPFNISLPAGCSDNGPCGKFYYYVSLIRKGEENDPSAKTRLFRYRSLSFDGLLGVTPGTVTGRRLSYLDRIASQNCSPSEVNNPEYPYTASWEDDGHFSCQYGPVDNEELVLDVTGRRLLFVIAVNAYPGETVQPISYNGSFTLISGTAPNLVTTNCNTVTTIGPLNRTQTEPTGCANNIPGIRFGASEPAGIAGFPNSKRVGVYLQGPSSYTVQDLDFLVSIKTEPAMANISILAGQLPSTAVTLYNEGIDPKEKRAYLSINNQNFSISTSPLFYIVINGPIAASGCADVDISLIGPRRIRATQFNTQICCTPPLIGSDANVHFGSIPSCNTPYCSPDFQLQVKKVTSFPSGGDLCSDLYFNLYMANTGSIGFSYPSGTAVMDITHDGTLTNTSTNLPVFSPDISLSLTYIVSVQIISSSVLRLTLNYASSSSPISIASGISRLLGTFKLTGSNVCIQTIYFSDGTIDQGTCVVQSFATEIANTPGDDICIQSLNLSFQTQYQQVPNSPIATNIQEVTFSVPAGGCTFTGTSNWSGSAAACVSCATAGTYTVTPSLDVNPLSGVTTYDLVLISQHILGTVPLANPYKIIAADANKSNSVTASDIVELRKLILGIYSKLPNNTSWRFVPKSFVFPTMGNPLQSGFTEFASITLPSSAPIQSDFYGIKIGDVNGSVLANDGGPQLSASTDREATTLTLNYALPANQRGETIEIPIFAHQSAAVVAWQLALNYDPSQWHIKGVRWPASATSRPHQLSAWNEPAPGELRLNWFDGDGTPIALNDQSPIAYLQVEQLGRAESGFQIAPTLSSEAYTTDGRVLTCNLSAAPSYQNAPVDKTFSKTIVAKWTANIYPNPASQEFRVEVRLPIGGNGTLTFFDLMGREVIRHKCLLSPGENVFTSAQLPTLSTGLYMVRFDTPSGRQTLRFVKQ